MPRARRNECKYGIYHVMVRGVNKQNIFSDDEDRILFVRLIESAKKEFGFELYAWCLMKNHVHLLPRFKPVADDFGGTKRLALAMHKINCSYAKYFNEKYDRVGHFFQDRYKSECVADDAYLQTVVRYIHRNPVKAGLVEACGDYEWSSYEQYLCDGLERIDSRFYITDTDFMLKMLGEHEFFRFNEEDNDDVCMDDDDLTFRMEQERIKKIVLSNANCGSTIEFRLKPLEYRKNIALFLYDRELDVAFISRLTGVSRNTIYRMKKTNGSLCR